MLVEEERRRCIVHLWDANVGVKEDHWMKKPTLVRCDS